MGNHATDKPEALTCSPPVRSVRLGAARPGAPIGSFWFCPEKNCGKIFMVVKTGPFTTGWLRVSRRKMVELSLAVPGKRRSSFSG